ncbi:hypothetical protein M885DRAFT_530989 [Pelagophyceae sp. CCMP2097]|nr:hypothetical protein M885DRAFT_530989 [Pelagophyceae sp. CCMP2097]|mmetsp:Transcript_26744/g.92032  ORF Transcript_26744/g.92032 Transcript_26744/m.92032 type:complete len:355 (-) Transcript_26744:40-1104(-)|eukprot:CAMPEP_0206808718 /NCGR_PEP_ID=MMETSP0975-20121206/5883_1 /ASSEMBLY_ACC=CAM_ASM_000399 /TAXON_ID=483370 /ORGANISM="non described non described, Strain CCMP2097" /LENGTH=354 /DNA_ID=CAMNT_0054350811 /DNA_START=26 /DNA_END=1090 /DNA_ORIENTATION=+
MEVLVLGPDVFVLLAALVLGAAYVLRGLTKQPLRIRLEEIWVYPIKSCRGIKVTSAKLDSQTGLEHDRRWMVVDDNGAFVSQRRAPKLALVVPKLVLENGALVGLEISAPGMPALRLQRGTAAVGVQVRCWTDRVGAVDEGDAAAKWFAKYCDMAGLRLVQIAPRDDAKQRACDSDYAPKGVTTGFSDGFPILVASSASLAELNAKLAANKQPPVPMDRFRPNLILSAEKGAAQDLKPFAEDHWQQAAVGGTKLRICKPCARCKMPTIDQATGVASGADSSTDDSAGDEGGGPRRGAEPTATMSQFRSGKHLGYQKDWHSEVFFGQNAYCRKDGATITVGDAVVPQRKTTCIVC